MEYVKAPTSRIIIIDPNNNNNSSHNHRKKKKRRRTRTTNVQQSFSPSSLLTIPNQHNISPIRQDPRIIQRSSIKNSIGWTKKWTKWFSSCGTERSPQTNINPILKRARTKSETDVFKHGNINDDEKKKLSTTTSTFAIGQNSNDNLEHTSRRSSQYQHQSNERIHHSSGTLYRETSRRYSNPFFTSARYGGGRTSIASIPLTTITTTTAAAATTTTTINTSQKKQASHLSHSVDRLHKKSRSRELRYEEHDDYIPPPLYSIQCHPTIEHYTKSLNQSSYFSSNHRRSQIEAYQSSSIHNRLILPRPYSNNIPHSQSLQIMSKTSASDNNNDYGKLSDCHSPLTPLENSSVKAPRRIESNYSQFPIQQEPVYANTQSLYDNILYPQSTTRVTTRMTSQERKSCASQTQLTWTMATFSSFVDLENPTAIIPQPDPNTLYSIVQHHRSPSPISTSPELIQQRTSPRLQYTNDPQSSHYQRPRSPTSATSLIIEKRDGSFQTYLSISPSQDIHANRQLFIHEPIPSPISADLSATTAQQQQQQQHRHHHHHHHRKHKSRNRASSCNISTRDVGLQVNIQTVKKITFTSQKSDESSAMSTATPSSTHTNLQTPRELRNVETNTEPLVTKRDMGTSYESALHAITSSSQTTDTSSPNTSITMTTTTTNRQTKAAQTTNKTLRDQSIETNDLGLFVCDLSSFLKNGSDELSLLNIQRKS